MTLHSLTHACIATLMHTNTRYLNFHGVLILYKAYLKLIKILTYDTLVPAKISWSKVHCKNTYNYSTNNCIPGLLMVNYCWNDVNMLANHMCDTSVMYYGWAFDLSCKSVIYVCTYTAYTYIHTYICMYVCVYVRMYLCMYTCTKVHVYICM